jgi:hypothetical protein
LITAGVSAHHQRWIPVFCSAGLASRPSCAPPFIVGLLLSMRHITLSGYTQQNRNQIAAIRSPARISERHTISTMRATRIRDFPSPPGHPPETRYAKNQLEISIEPNRQTPRPKTNNVETNPISRTDQWINRMRDPAHRRFEPRRSSAPSRLTGTSSTVGDG